MRIPSLYSSFFCSGLALRFGQAADVFGQFFFGGLFHLLGGRVLDQALAGRRCA